MPTIFANDAVAHSYTGRSIRNIDALVVTIVVQNMYLYSIKNCSILSFRLNQMLFDKMLLINYASLLIE